ncbi:MAG TPA: CHRD domain-containing protein [Xanthobacteraceae bacterium]|jgi:hypothetical protein|nr:CHRD domain-containing protein [Xanthobacteraceae bacterium]
MRVKSLVSVAFVAAPLTMLGVNAGAEEFFGKFSGFEEVGPLNAETGAIFSPGTATVSLDLNRNAKTITFKLSYSGLSAPVTQAHIHFGKRHVPGGIMVFFCTNLNNGPAGTQPCPQGTATVTGMFTGASVVGPTAQHVTAGDFDALVAALESDTAYGNIHTTNFPAGEIRAQIREHDRDER